MLKNHFIVHVLLAGVLFCLCSPCFSQPVERYVHKNAFLDQGPSPELLTHFAHKSISSLQAASFAVDYLKSRRVSNIVVCEVAWIAAPFGGYLVDAKGKVTIDGALYTIFRVGVRDGTDQNNGEALPGEVFVFLALGKDRSGREHWYPAPGPDSSWARAERGEPVTESMLAYEFLLHREKLLTLDRRYR